METIIYTNVCSVCQEGVIKVGVVETSLYHSVWPLVEPKLGKRYYAGSCTGMLIYFLSKRSLGTRVLNSACLNVTHHFVIM